MEKVVYVLMAREKDSFKIIYVDESEKTEEKDFFIKKDKFKCWISHAGSENNLYLAILPMWESEKDDRERIVRNTITKYKPICNEEK